MNAVVVIETDRVSVELPEAPRVGDMVEIAGDDGGTRAHASVREVTWVLQATNGNAKFYHLRVDCTKSSQSP